MREELSRNTSIGDLEGIILFNSILFDSRATTCAAIRSLCAFLPSSKLNYLAALYLFDDLGIISFNGHSVVLSKDGESLAEKNNQERLFFIGKRVFAHVIENEYLSCKEIRYSIETNAIEMPANAFLLSAAIYRNLLISINALIRSTNVLIVSTRYEVCFEMLCKKARRTLTQNDLLQQLEKQRIDGELAELFVLDYENKRLASAGKKAKRISQIDVAAGYDILSFQESSSNEYDSFIEVKSYHGKPHFYWSENERITSKALADRYSLFLVDIEKVSEQEYQPLIIRNPYNNLPEDSWIIEPQSFYICKI